MFSSGSFGAAGATIGTVYATTITSASAQISGTISAGTYVGSLFSAGSFGAAGATIGNLYNSMISINTTNTSANALRIGYNALGQIFYERSDGQAIAVTYTDNNFHFNISNSSATNGDINLRPSINSTTGGSVLIYGKNKDSTSSTYGILVLQNGGLAIKTTADATGITSGGGATIAGGVAIGKSLYAGSLTVSGDSILTGSTSTGSLATSSIVTSSITTGNVKAGTGILGPFIVIQNRFIDVTTGTFAGYTSSNTILFSEDGNPGINSSIGYTDGFGKLSDGSNDNMAWNSARLVIRGASLNTGTAGSSIVIQPFAIQSVSGTLYTQASFTASDYGSDRGYTTWISPWFSTNIVSDIQSLGVKVLSLNGSTGGNVRIGTTYLQFKS